MANEKEPKNKLSIQEGDRFGRLTIMYEVKNKEDHNRKFMCECDCGNETVVYLMKLRSGKTKSCGCIQREKAKETMRTHGLGNHKLYSVWNRMMQRCNNTKCSEYKNYGARGIKVCDEWEDVRIFINDMEPTYQPGLTIDRIDNSKGYSKYNCKWSTPLEQSNNKRDNRIVTYNGKSYTVAELSKKLTISYGLLLQRLNYGIDLCDAVSKERLVKKKIVQMDLSGNEIRRFDSMKEAEKATGVLHSGISRTISGSQSQSGGFIWREIGGFIRREV